MSTVPRDEIRIQAANDYAWAESKLAMYREDGGTAPEPIRRLHALADLICKSPVVMPAAASANEGDAGQIEALKTALAAAEAEAAAANERAKLSDARAKASIEALRDTSVVLARTADHLEGGAGVVGMLSGGTVSAPPVVKAVTVGNGGMVVTRDATPNSSTIITPTAALPGEPPPPPVERKPITLQHGLWVRQRVTQHAVIFCEPAKGVWFSRALTPTGLGPETATEPGKWFSDVWEEMGMTAHAELRPHWSVAESAKGSDAAKAKSTIKGAEWNPTDEQIGGFVASIGEVAAKLPGVTVTPELIRSLVAKFKSEFADKEMGKPAVSFYHYAAKSLKGS